MLVLFHIWLVNLCSWHQSQSLLQHH
uniref:Uncharacterized protein n=1 Tax=Rhizophora mucronata TaxID=61149 RepID=A0A2P2PDK0_RHIMU